MKEVIINTNKGKTIHLDVKEDSHITGSYVLRNTESLKIDGVFRHVNPGVMSRITIKAVVYDSAHFDCEGVLKIEKGAKSVDTYLKISCLLVGGKATARVVPSLEIFEDEVKAGHGASVGYIDEQQIYYLESHGMTKIQAEEMLIQAFLQS